MKKRYLAMFMAVSMMVSSVLCDTGMQTVMAAEIPAKAESTEEIAETETAEEENSEAVLEETEVQSAEVETSAQEEQFGDSGKEGGEKNEENSSEAVLEEAEETKNQNIETENQESSAELEAKEEKTEDVIEKEEQETAEGSQSEEVIEETENMDSALEENARTIVYEGKSNDISWSIDDEGMLLVTGSGDYEDSFDVYGRRLAPWYENSEAVFSAKVTVIGMTDTSYMFYRCKKLSSVDLSGFDTSQVTDMVYMFSDCDNLSSVDLSGFDTAQVTDMGHMFDACINLSSVDLSSFDTTQVTNMRNMFDYCNNLSSVDLSSFDTAQVTDMTSMFRHCINLSSVDLSSFDTAQVTKMTSMFSDCNNLSSVDLSGFDTAQVTNMRNMFAHCSNLSSVDLSSFDTAQLTDMGYMFWGCSNLSSVDLSSFGTAQLTDMEYMFWDCRDLSSVDLSSFDTAQVTNMGGLFSGCSNLSSVDLSSFDTTQATNMGGLFSGCSNLSSVDLSSFDTAQVRRMGHMFSGCSNLSSVDLSGFDTAQVTMMENMFEDCSNLSSVDLSGFDTSQVGKMEYMFSGCSNLSSVDLSGFDTTQVTDMERMFSGCSNLSSVDLSSFDTSQVADMGGMFYGCSNLRSLDLSSFDLSSLKWVYYMFYNCGLTELDTPRNLSIEIPLPDTFESADGTQYTTLPMNMEKSMHLSVKKPAQYTVSFKGNGATSGSMLSQSMTYGNGQALTANTFKRTGYTFTGWNTKADGTGKGYADKADGSKLTEEKDAAVTLYAQWKKVTYKITYNLNNGKNNSANPTSYDVMTAAITLKNPTRTGYTFTGWYTDAALTKKITTIAKGSTGNKTLYAGWKPNTYTITYKGNGSTSGSMTSTSCKYGSSYALKANAFKKTGYSFAGWNTKADGTGTTYQDKASVKNLSSTAGGTVNLYVKWTKVKYTITYHLNGGKNNSGNPVSYYVTSSSIILKNPTRTGYTFAGWYKDSAYKTKVTKITQGSTGNRALYAKWTPNKYNIVYKGNGSTSGSMTASKDCKYGSSYTLKANAFKKTGYSFAGWNTKADGTGTTYKNKASVKNLTSKNGGTINLYAKWSKVKYTITYKLNGGKNSSANPSSYYITTSTITLKNPTRTGYKFTGWYKDSAYKSKVTKISKGSCGNRTLYAGWTPNKYNIVYKGNGSTSGSMTASKNCKYGSSYTLKANAFKKKGYVFAGWNTKADGSGKAYKNKASVKNLSSKAGASVTLYARWKKK